jgi:hypothetical protein
MEGLAPMSDWRYEPARMVLREHCLSVLLKKFGSQLDDNGVPRYSTESIYECAHDWVSQGNPSASGIVRYYETYYGST